MLAGVAWLAALLCTGAFAQTGPGAAKSYPAKPIRLIVPFPAGASSDLVGRMLAQKLAEQMGEQVITDNRAGAGGNLGIAAAAKWIADGGAGSARLDAWIRPELGLPKNGAGRGGQGCA